MYSVLITQPMILCGVYIVFNVFCFSGSLHFYSHEYILRSCVKLIHFLFWLSSGESKEPDDAII